MAIPVVDEHGCVKKYECRVVNETENKMEECIIRHTTKGVEKAEAVKRCYEELKDILEDIREAVREKVRSKPISDELLVRSLKCMELPAELTNETSTAVREFMKMRGMLNYELKSVFRNCSQRIANLTDESEIERVKQECDKLTEKIEEVYEERLEDLRDKLKEMYEMYTPAMKYTCINEFVRADTAVKAYEEEKKRVLMSENLTQEEKREILKELVRNKTSELRARGISIAAFVKTMLGKDETRKVATDVLKKERQLFERILEDPEGKLELVSAVEDEPEDVELLQEVVKDGEAKIMILKRAKVLPKLKMSLMKREVAKEILPLALRKRIEKINVTDLETEQIGNQTIVRAKIIESRRILFLIPVNIPKEVRFIEDNILEEKAPWWTFLTFG